MDVVCVAGCSGVDRHIFEFTLRSLYVSSSYDTLLPLFTGVHTGSVMNKGAIILDRKLGSETRKEGKPMNVYYLRLSRSTELAIGREER